MNVRSMMRLMRFFLHGVGRPTASFTFAALLGVSIPSAAQARKLYPVDEAKKDPSFLTFRRKLITALQRRDRAFLLRVVDAKIRYSFGASDGIRGFKKQWHLSRAGASWDSLRHELLALLALGGAFQQGNFWAPYVYSNWSEGPENETDSFTHGAITGREVALRSRPTTTAPIVTRLTYDIVKVPEWPNNRAWVKVVAPSGQSGYVAGQYLRSPVGYRAAFRKVRGQWKLTALVQGD